MSYLLGTMSYLLAGQPSELERLQLQSRVWESAGRRLLAEIGDGAGKTTLDVGCGPLGWLRLLSDWVGADGRCIGTDNEPSMLAAAEKFCADEGLRNCELRQDDLFATRLPPGQFDLVHARFELAPLGRFDDQIAVYSRLLRPGGLLVLEDPDSASWRYQPDAPSAQRLIGLIVSAFRAGGGDFDAGRRGYTLLTAHGLQPHLRADIIALPPGHAYLTLPLQFATSLRTRLTGLISEPELDALLAAATEELSDPHRWGTTFTLIQTWAVIGT